MKIIIVAQTIFPRISPRSFRATELAKAFSQKGHDVTLIASLGNYNYDEFISNYNVKVKDLGTPIFSLRNSDGKLNLPIWKKAVIFLFMRILEFPDILLMKNVKRALLNEEKIDLLISVAIPHSLHWGVSLISKKDRNFDVWVSDCGDPFMGNTFNKPMFYFKYIEKYWGKKTDYISVPVEDARKAYYKEVQNKVRIIPQGFDFTEIKLAEYSKNKVPTFLYAGLFYAERRDPTRLFEYLCNLQYDFKFIIYATKVELIMPFIDKLKDKVEIRLPIDRNSLITEMSKADFLLNIKNAGTSAQVPSKLIDYALSQRPIIEITSDFDSIEQISFDAFLKGDYSSQKLIHNLSQYDSNNVADTFLKLYTDR